MTISHTDTTPHPRFEWGAVMAGAILALAISIVLMQFGSAIGLSATTMFGGNTDIAAWGIITSGIWILWVQLLSSLAGGYLAGRLRTPSTTISEYEVELRDAIAGLSTWAISTVIVFIFVSLGAAFATYLTAMSGTYEVNETLSDSERNTGIIFAFVVGSTSLLSAVAAWWAGSMGGKHRDDNTDFSPYLTFRK